MSKIKIFALGGLNEIGKNMYVVHVDEDMFVFDAGLKYVTEKMYGIDYIIPNYDYILQHKEQLKGIFITHGHEENCGAVVDMLKDCVDLPIYVTKFGYDVLQKSLEEANVQAKHLHVIKPHQKILFGECSIFPITLTHAIPDCVGYVLYTKDGAIFYTGDFMFDSTMMGRYKTDIGKLAYVGKQGVLCLLSESMYAEKKGFTSPNHRINRVLRETLIRSQGRVICTVLSSNMYRIQELFNEVSKLPRKVVIMGKQLQNAINDALAEGYLQFDKNKIGDLSDLNDKNTLILLGNERKKPFYNMNRIVGGYDKYIKLKDTDTVMFLEVIADSMEMPLVHLADEIAKLGSDVVILPSKKYLSHHASSEDLMMMLNLMNPKYYMPVRGEYRYQVANADVANVVGIDRENIILKQNGDVVLFENGELVPCFDHIPTDEISIDGNFNEDIGELVLKDREVLSDNGIVIVSVVIDKKNKEVISGPEIVTRGFIYVKDNADLIKEAANISQEVIEANTTLNYVDYAKVKNGIREKLGKYLYKETECKPMIITVINEIQL